MKDPYRRIARYYDMVVGRPSKGLRSAALGLVAVKPGMSVLEIGCGTGANLTVFQRKGFRVSGIDASPAMLERARSKLGDASDLLLAEAGKLPHPDGSFDLVMAFLTMHEIPPAARGVAVGEMVRVLAPRGRLLLVDHSAGPVPFPQGWLSRLLIAGLEIGAGWQHFRCYRDFLARNGLQGLIEAHDLSVEYQEVLGAGTIHAVVAYRPSACQ